MIAACASVVIRRAELVGGDDLAGTTELNAWRAADELDAGGFKDALNYGHVQHRPSVACLEITDGRRAPTRVSQRSDGDADLIMATSGGDADENHYFA